jgi:diaminopimelate epimerase
MKHQSLQFTKMHGLGNDFVVINNFQKQLDWRELPAAMIADRHLGIGCDQILLIEPSSSADVFCRILNADGSEAEQCGNGLRCVARYMHEKKLLTRNNLTIETVAGNFPVTIKDYDHIRVTIAEHGISATPMKVLLPTLGTSVQGSALSLRNPHFIIKVNDIETPAAWQLGPALAVYPDFPNGTNVGFMQIINDGHIKLRTYERGSGETNACGSNACAAVASGILDGLLTGKVSVEFKYGQLLIEWEGTGRPVHMTGPAALVFDGEYGLTR